MRGLMDLEQAGDHFFNKAKQKERNTGSSGRGIAASY